MAKRPNNYPEEYFARYNLPHTQNNPPPRP
jgi:hypothetical protein